MDFKKIINFIKEAVMKKDTNKYMGNLVIIALIGVLLVIAASFFKGTKEPLSTAKAANGGNAIAQEEMSTKDYEAALQNQLKNTLEEIDGVGRVELMIYFESGEEQVPAVNINDSTNLTEEKDNTGGTRNTTQKNNGSTVVITNDGDKTEPLIVKTYKPKITGVCIVAEGAEEKITELRITKAVCNLFDITQDKVNVYPMKK